MTEQAETLGSYLGEDTLMRDRVTATEELTRESHEYENRPPRLGCVRLRSRIR